MKAVKKAGPVRKLLGHHKRRNKIICFDRKINQSFSRLPHNLWQKLCGIRVIFTKNIQELIIRYTIMKQQTKGEVQGFTISS